MADYAVVVWWVSASFTAWYSAEMTFSSSRPADVDIPRLVERSFLARAESHESLSSTNDRAREALADGGPLPFLAAARRQTAGRGRGGNRWWTGEGSLAFSLALGADRLPEDRRQVGLVSLGAAVALVRAVRARVGSLPLGIHWPNDVFLNGRKLAGVLVEAPAGGGVVVGVGVNTNSSLADAPEELREKIVTLLDATGSAWNPTDAMLAVLAEFEPLLDEARRRPDAVARSADELCLQRGRELAVVQGEKTVTGRCVGIAPDGALLLDTPDGRQALHGGVVSFTGQ